MVAQIWAGILSRCAVFGFLRDKAVSPARCSFIAPGFTSLLHIAPRRRLDCRVTGIAGMQHRRLALPGVTGQPDAPVIPPAPRVLICIFEPGVRVFADAIVGPVMTLVVGRRVDHPGDMPRGSDHKALGPAQQVGAGVGAAPRHDVVVMGGEDVRRRLDGSQVEFDPAAIQFAGFQVVLQVGVAQVPAIHRAGQVGAVVVPEQQVQRDWLQALEVLVDVVVPPQVIGAQQREGVAHVLALEQADGAVLSANGALAVSHQLFVDEQLVAYHERTIGGKDGPIGLFKGEDMGNTFSLLRPNDLWWNYNVDKYLKGLKPIALDLLFWNNDSTNLPGPMYCWYLRHTYLQNDLKSGELNCCGVKLDLRAIEAPAYILATHDDHIVPWRSAYASTNLLGGTKRFVLGASGHIAGVINPPANHKRHYWTNNRVSKNPDTWFKNADQHPGSWWNDWCVWLASHAGERQPSVLHTGNTRYPAIESAPGRYVKQ